MDTKKPQITELSKRDIQLLKLALVTLESTLDGRKQMAKDAKALREKLSGA